MGESWDNMPLDISDESKNENQEVRPISPNDQDNRPKDRPISPNSEIKEKKTRKPKSDISNEAKVNDSGTTNLFLEKLRDMDISKALFNFDINNPNEVYTYLWSKRNESGISNILMYIVRVKASLLSNRQVKPKIRRLTELIGVQSIIKEIVKDISLCLSVELVKEKSRVLKELGFTSFPEKKEVI